MIRVVTFALAMAAAGTGFAQAPAAPAQAAPAQAQEPSAAPPATAAPAVPAQEAPAAAPEAPPAQPPPAGQPNALPPPPAPPPAAVPGAASPGQAPAPVQAGVPPAYAHRYMLEAELRDLALKRSELGLGGPIALIITGGAVLLVSGTLLLLALAADSYCDSSDYYGYEDDYTYGRDCDDSDTDTLYIVGGFGAVLGGLTAVYGIIRLIDRAGERRALGVRMKEIRRELQGYSYGLRLGLGPERAGASLRVSF